MTTNNLQAGYQYLVDNNLIDNYQNYQFTELDINERKIWCIDEFHALPPDTKENILRNIDIKLELEKIAKNSSYTCFSEYIYDLIIYTREITCSHMNPSCSIF